MISGFLKAKKRKIDPSWKIIQKDGSILIWKEEPIMQKKNTYVECICKGWKTGMGQISSAQVLAFNHGMKYTGKIFSYCPWCGKKLTSKKVN